MTSNRKPRRTKAQAETKGQPGKTSEEQPDVPVQEPPVQEADGTDVAKPVRADASEPADSQLQAEPAESSAGKYSIGASSAESAEGSKPAKPPASAIHPEPAVPEEPDAQPAPDDDPGPIPEPFGNEFDEDVEDPKAPEDPGNPGCDASGEDAVPNADDEADLCELHARV